MDKKPKSIFVFAIFGIIVGLAIGYVIWQMYHFRRDFQGDLPIIFMLFALSVAIGFISSSLGLLKLKRWARNLYLFVITGYMLLWCMIPSWLKNFRKCQILLKYYLFHLMNQWLECWKMNIILNSITDTEYSAVTEKKNIIFSF